MKLDPATLKGKTITITDTRTGVTYQSSIVDAKNVYGRLRIQVVKDAPWIIPTPEELESVK